MNFVSWIRRLLAAPDRPTPANAASLSEPDADDANDLPTLQTLQEHGNQARSKGDLQVAETRYLEAIQRDADYAPAWLGLGLTYMDLMMMTKAQHAFERSRRLEPQRPDASLLLGILAMEQGQTGQALSHWQVALEVDAAFRPALNRVLPILLTQDPARAVRLARSALAVDETAADLQLFLGIVLQQTQGYEEAHAALLKCLAVEPGNADALLHCGYVLLKLHREDEAVAKFTAALLANPEYEVPAWAVPMAQLKAIPASDGDVRNSREHLRSELTLLEDWFDETRTIRGFNAVGTLQPFYLAYQEQDNRDLLATYGALCCRLMQAWQRRQPAVVPNHASREKNRVAIISQYTGDHPVWNAITKGMLAGLQSDSIDLFVFALDGKLSEETLPTESGFVTFVHGHHGLPAWYQAITSCQPAVIIYPEIGMDAMTLQLASMRLAPFQMVSWGHPETTGLPTIDYYLSAERFEDQQSERYYCEELVPLSGLGCTYEELAVVPETVDLESLGIDASRPILLCPGTPYKYAPENDGVLVAITKRLPQCQLIFFTGEKVRRASDLLIDRLAKTFEAQGLDSKRFVLTIPWLARPSFFGLMRRADLMLDTIGFSGFNTAIQAIEAGLPIVTRKGRFMRGRLASGILEHLDLGELVAVDNASYVDVVTRLVQDRSYRAAIIEAIEHRRSRLFGDFAPGNELAALIERLCRSARSEPVR